MHWADLRLSRAEDNPDGEGILTLIIRKSKTDSEAKGAVRQLMQLGQNTPCCVVRSVSLLLVLRNKLESMGKIFGVRPLVFCDGTPFKAQDLTRLLRRFSAQGESVSTHSLRSGGATHLINIGTSSEAVQSLGRWRSDVYKDYLWGTPASLRAAAARESTSSGQN